MKHIDYFTPLADMLPKKVYRFGIDDNIWFLRDIAQNRPASLFDNPYLKLIKELHEAYGTKFVLNLFYETADQKEYFNLSMMPNDYKDEWKSCSDWLRLAFHAKSESTTYELSSYEEVYRDCSNVHREIVRFAGEDSLSLYTTIHCTSTLSDGCRALVDLGIKGIVCLDPGKGPQIRRSYYLNDDETFFMDDNAIVKDENMNLILLKNDIVINRGKLEDITPYLDSVLLSDKNKQFMQILLHEQYFYEDYPRHLPDYRERMETSLEWLQNNGYTSAYMEDIL